MPDRWVNLWLTLYNQRMQARLEAIVRHTLQQFNLVSDVSSTFMHDASREDCCEAYIRTSHFSALRVSVIANLVCFHW